MDENEKEDLEDGTKPYEEEDDDYTCKKPHCHDFNINDCHYHSPKYFWRKSKYKIYNALWCSVNAAGTGMAIGGKYGGAGGWIVGGISQLFGIIVPTIMGFIVGFTGGLIYSKEEMNSVIADYRLRFGGESFPPYRGTIA